MHVTAKALAAAARSLHYGGEIMALLLSDPERHAAGLRITDEIIRAAAANWQGLKIMQLLLDWQPEEVHITMELQMEIIENKRQGRAITMLLLERQADDTHITGDIAWRILEYYGADVIRLFRGRRGDSYFMSQRAIRLLANHLVHLAILNDTLDYLEILLAMGADEDIFIDYGWTQLTLGARQGDIPVVELLLAKKAELSTVTTTRWSPLDIAADCGYVEVIRLLLERGAIADENWLRALVSASFRGYVEVIELLFEKVVDISGSANDDWTPLGAASRNGHLETVQLLLTRGANPLVGNEHGWSPLDTAAANGHVEVVKILLIHESFNTVHDKRSLCGTIANTLAYYGHIDLLEYIVQHNNADLQTPDRLKRTPLLFAARGRRVQTFEYLVDHGLPLNTLDVKGDGLMSYAASPGCPKLLEAILEHDVESSTQPGLWSPLHWACRSGDSRVVERIVEAMKAKERQRGPITAVDAGCEWTRKWTPRAIAIFHGYENMLWGLSEASQAAIGARDTIVHAMSYRNHAMCTFCFHQVYGPRFQCRTCVGIDCCFMCKPYLKHLHESSHKWKRVKLRREK